MIASGLGRHDDIGDGHEVALDLKDTGYAVTPGCPLPGYRQAATGLIFRATSGGIPTTDGIDEGAPAGSQRERSGKDQKQGKQQKDGHSSAETTRE